jgi:hypothetical protein
MKNFPERYNLLNTTQEKIENLNRTITRVKLIFCKFLTTKAKALDVLTDIFYPHFKEELVAIFYKLFQKEEYLSKKQMKTL